MLRHVAALFILVAGAAEAGPLSKFDNKAPVARLHSSRSLEDIERCLLDLDGWGMPVVYRQPDRPDVATIVWPKGGGGAGLANARLDLKRAASGTDIVSWMPAKQALECTPS